MSNTLVVPSSDTAKALSEFLRTVSSIRQTVQAAEDARYTPSPASTTHDGYSASRSGEHGDPTADVATDPARLALSDALRSLEDVWRAATINTLDAHARVADALDAWQNG